MSYTNYNRLKWRCLWFLGIWRNYLVKNESVEVVGEAARDLVGFLGGLRWKVIS